MKLSIISFLTLLLLITLFQKVKANHPYGVFAITDDDESDLRKRYEVDEENETCGAYCNPTTTTTEEPLKPSTTTSITTTSTTMPNTKSTTSTTSTTTTTNAGTPTTSKYCTIYTNLLAPEILRNKYECGVINSLTFPIDDIKGYGTLDFGLCYKGYCCEKNHCVKCNNKNNKYRDSINYCNELTPCHGNNECCFNNRCVALIRHNSKDRTTTGIISITTTSTTSSSTTSATSTSTTSATTSSTTSTTSTSTTSTTSSSTISATSSSTTSDTSSSTTSDTSSSTTSGTSSSTTSATSTSTTSTTSTSTTSATSSSTTSATSSSTTSATSSSTTSVTSSSTTSRTLPSETARAKDRCGIIDNKNYGSCTDGECCSKYGWCGVTEAHCDVNSGCQSEFGRCNRANQSSTPTSSTTSAISPSTTSRTLPTETARAKDRCGIIDNKNYGSCADGECCSKYGWCGVTEAHCSVNSGCQSEFGRCNSSSDNPNNNNNNNNNENNENVNNNIRTSRTSRCGRRYGKCDKNQCCSKYGWCGTSESYCSVEAGCQSEFGRCGYSSDNTNDVNNTDENHYHPWQCGEGIGSCKPDYCCSKYGWCGRSISYCSRRRGCQSSFGSCW